MTRTTTNLILALTGPTLLLVQGCATTSAARASVAPAAVVSQVAIPPTAEPKEAEPACSIPEAEAKAYLSRVYAELTSNQDMRAAFDRRRVTVNSRMTQCAMNSVNRRSATRFGPAVAVFSLLRGQAVGFMAVAQRLHLEQRWLLEAERFDRGIFARLTRNAVDVLGPMYNALANQEPLHVALSTCSQPPRSYLVPHCELLQAYARVTFSQEKADASWFKAYERYRKSLDKNTERVVVTHPYLKRWPLTAFFSAVVSTALPTVGQVTTPPVTTPPTQIQNQIRTSLRAMGASE